MRRSIRFCRCRRAASDHESGEEARIAVEMRTGLVATSRFGRVLPSVLVRSDELALRSVMRSRGTAVLVLTASFGLAFWLGTGPLALLYTPHWAAEAIPVLFGPLALIAALLAFRSVPWSLGGYGVGVILGEVIGEHTYAAQQAHLNAQLADPAYLQDWEPSHPGWWIATLAFLTLTGTGCWRGRRAARRSDTASNRTAALVGSSPVTGPSIARGSRRLH